MFRLFVKSNNKKKLIDKARSKKALIEQAQYLATKARHDEITVEDNKGNIVYSESVGVLTSTAISDLAKITCEEYYKDDNI